MFSQLHNAKAQKKENKDARGILFIVENNTVPPDIRVWREALTAKRAGFPVTVISPKNGKFSKSYEVIDDIEIYRHPSVNHKGGKINQMVEYANALLWQMVLCLRIFGKKRFHIIHAANPPDHIFFISLFFKTVGVKFIFDHHDLAPELYISKFNGKKDTIFKVLRLMETLSCRTADAVISSNHSYKKHVIDSYGIRPEKVFIVRNDPEAPKAPSNGQTYHEQNKHLTKLLYVGSINNQDGVDVLIKVVDILVNRLDERRIKCNVVGDGDDLHRVKKLCTDLRLDPYFTFTGYIYDRNMVQTLIEEADICLETAPGNEVNRRSTFIKVMEYMAAGKPIVAFDLEETRYSAQESAILIEQGDLSGFAEAIKELMCDHGLREKLGRNGRERIENALNWDNAAKELLRAYEYVDRN